MEGKRRQLFPVGFQLCDFPLLFHQRGLQYRLQAAPVMEGLQGQASGDLLIAEGNLSVIVFNNSYLN